jgi:ectoine hydroxylase-related dioxygenase (phytanoyl-CoA dioxygenase family)
MEPQSSEPRRRPVRRYAGGAREVLQDLFNPNALPAYRRLLENSEAADVIAKVWGTGDVWFFYEQVFLKEGGESRRTPWHQDSSYLPIAGDLLAVMWISFDPVPKEDSLEFVRGSHRGVMYDGSRFDPKDDTAPLYGDGSLPRLPNIEAQRDRWDILSWAIEPGDVLIFHPGMLHGGAGTRKGRRRRTLSLRFFGPDAVFAPRPGWRVNEQSTDEPKSAIEDLNRKLQPGQPFRHASFPKLRPRI